MPVDFYDFAKTKYPTGSNQIWVDQATGNDGNIGTSGLPKASIQAGVSAVGTTGTVWVRNGTYNAVTISNKNGSASQWVHIVAQAGHSPKITSSGMAAINFQDSSYLLLFGFEVTGIDSESTPYADCVTAVNSHHIAMWKCWAHHGSHGFGAPGNFGTAHNYDICYNFFGPRLSRWNEYAASAVSLYAMDDGGNGADGYANRLIGNCIYDSKNTVGIGPSTDGNGIIIDACNASAGQGGTLSTDKTLVARNITVANGARGIHAFMSDNVDIVFNTIAHNVTQAGSGGVGADQGEATTYGSDDGKFRYNVVGTRVNRANGSNNVWFQGSGWDGSSGNIAPANNVITRGDNPALTSNTDKRTTGEGYWQSPNDTLSNIAGWRPASASNTTVNVSSLDSTLYNVLKDWPDYFGDLPPAGGTAWSVGALEPTGGGGGGGAPVANFMVFPNPATPGASIQFTDTSTNTPTSRLWNFGDGTTSTATNPTKSYAQAGTYNVSLTATNGSGSNAKTISVVVAAGTPTVWYEAESASLGGGVEAPQVSVENPGYVASGYVGFFGRIGNYVEFALTGQTAGAYQLQLRWGAISQSPAPSRIIKVNGSTVATVAFPSGSFAGSWADANRWVLSDPIPITLTSGANTIRIEHAGSTDYLYTDLDRIGVTAVGAQTQPPVANFGWSPATPTVNTVVPFNDQSTNSPTSWTWVWGDGTSNSTTQNPTHTYADVGTYTVQLTATNAAGSHATQKTITITSGGGGGGGGGGGTGGPDSLIVTGNVLQNLTAYTVHVQVRDTNGLVGEDTEQFDTDWDQPAAPTTIVVTI